MTLIIISWWEIQISTPWADFVKQAQNHIKLGKNFILIITDIL